MFETLLLLPPSFWVGAFLLLYGAMYAINWIGTGIGLPMLTVLGTVVFWYMGDAFYNDYANNYVKLFSSEVLDDAWWQVAGFVAVFLFLTPHLHKAWNTPYLHQGSHFRQMFQRGVDQPRFQQHLKLLFKGCLVVWFGLALIAIIRLKGESFYFFFPFLGYKAEPWGRDRIGSGIDALLSLASYFQMFVAGIFGVVAALAQDRRIRLLAMLLCLLTWPYYILDRTRNTMLTVVIPAVLAWVFLRLRGGIVIKFAAIGFCFLVVNAWMAFVISNRSTTSITAAFMQEGFDLQQDQQVHHEGLNMFEELCWINTFFKEGSYNPPLGERYFAELANPIPRSLWPGKPLIGIDYAIARGQAYDSGGAGVGATVSTGMIGQGVVNFRQVLGPAFAAFLMSLWAVLLARLDLRGDSVGRLPLLALGLILTFNLGRDITFITLYTFFFGMAIVWWLDRSYRQPMRQEQTVEYSRRITGYRRPRGTRQESGPAHHI